MAWRCCSSPRDPAPLCAHAHDRGFVLPLVVTAVNVGKVSRVIEKPFDANTLVETVKEALKPPPPDVDAPESARSRLGPGAPSLTDVISGSDSDSPSSRSSEPTCVFGYEMPLRSSHPTLDGPGPVLAAAERHGMLRGSPRGRRPRGRVADAPPRQHASVHEPPPTRARWTPPH